MAKNLFSGEARLQGNYERSMEDYNAEQKWNAFGESLRGYAEIKAKQQQADKQRQILLDMAKKETNPDLKALYTMQAESINTTLGEGNMDKAMSALSQKIYANSFNRGGRGGSNTAMTKDFMKSQTDYLTPDIKYFKDGTSLRTSSPAQVMVNELISNTPWQTSNPNAFGYLDPVSGHNMYYGATRLGQIPSKQSLTDAYGNAMVDFAPVDNSSNPFALRPNEL